MTKTAFITGITGQDGPYLAKILLNKGYQVYGMVRNVSNPNLYGISFLNIKDKVQLIFGDLSNIKSIEDALLEVKPDEIYHLASQSSVINSWSNCLNTLSTNADSSTPFLEYVKKNPKTKLFLAQSSELFGKNLENHEKNNFEPCSPYGVAKLASYHLGKIFREKYDLFIVNGLFYIHESPLRNINFFSRKVSQTVARIAAGVEKEIVLGNIDLYRDVGFAGDYMEAVYLALQREVPDDYIIATGQCTLLRDFVKEAFAEVGIDDYEKYLRFEKSYFRKNDPVKIMGFPQQTFQKLNWKPNTTVIEIVKQMLSHDIEFIKNPQNLESQCVIPYSSMLQNRS